MKTIIFDDLNGLAIPDGHVQDWVDALIDDVDNTSIPCISNETVVLGIRVAIRQGLIKHDQIQFKVLRADVEIVGDDLVFPDRMVTFDKDGRMNFIVDGKMVDWPLCWSTSEHYLEQLL